jgi:hypothetical protein
MPLGNRFVQVSVCSQNVMGQEIFGVQIEVNQKAESPEPLSLISSVL